MWTFKKQPKEEKVFRSRAPRVRVNPLNHAGFSRRSPEPAGEMRLGNISTSGLALLAERKEERLAVGAKISGDLTLGKAPGIPVHLEVMRLDGPTLGCRFIDIAPDLRKGIAKYFEVEIGAGELLPVPAAQLSEETDGTPLWFTGENGCEIFLVVADKKIVRFHLSFFGNLVDGGEEEPLRFGKVVENTLADEPGHKSSTLIHSEGSWSDEQIQSALRLVHQAYKLDPDLREKLLTLIKAGPASK